MTRYGETINHHYNTSDRKLKAVILSLITIKSAISYDFISLHFGTMSFCKIL